MADGDYGWFDGGGDTNYGDPGGGFDPSMLFGDTPDNSGGGGGGGGGGDWWNEYFGVGGDGGVDPTGSGTGDDPWTFTTGTTANGGADDSWINDYFGTNTGGSSDGNPVLGPDDDWQSFLNWASGGHGGPNTQPSGGGPNKLPTGNILDMLKKIFGSLGKNVSGGSGGGAGGGSGSGGSKPSTAANPLGALLQKLLAGGALGAGAIGNVLNAKTQSDYVKQMIEWRKQLQQLALNPDQVNALTSKLSDQLLKGVDPATINSYRKAFEQDLSQGLTKGVGNQTQSYLASRGLNLSPGATTDILAQSLAPYQQELTSQAGSEALGLAGIGLQGREAANSQLLNLLRTPSEGSIPPFLPQTDLTPLIQMLLGGGGGGAAGAGNIPGIIQMLQRLGLGSKSGSGGGATGSMDFASWLASMGFSPTDISALFGGPGTAPTQTSDGGSNSITGDAPSGTGVDTGGSGYHYTPATSTTAGGGGGLLNFQNDKFGGWDGFSA
jgi:hypothetical protein